MNIEKCKKCGYDIISEEIHLHRCKTVIDYRIEEETLWLFDGDIWYPRKLLQQPKGNIEKTTDDETEP